MWPRPSAELSFGTTSMRAPVCRPAAPASPALPTPHSLPIRCASSVRGTPPRSGNVTTTISPPDFRWTSSAILEISSSTDVGITSAKSLTQPTGCGIAVWLETGDAAANRQAASNGTASRVRIRLLVCTDSLVSDAAGQSGPERATHRYHEYVAPCVPEDQADSGVTAGPAGSHRGKRPESLDDPGARP